jgi:hypothetical protein
MDNSQITAPVTSANPTNISDEIRNKGNLKGMLLLGSAIFALLLVFVIVALFITARNQEIANNVNSFDECVAAGNPIMESYPRKCSTRDGKLFVEELGNSGEIINETQDEDSDQFSLYMYKNIGDIEDVNLKVDNVKRSKKDLKVSPIVYAINELLSGPSFEEREDGFLHEIFLQEESTCDGMNYEFSIESNTLTIEFCKDIVVESEEHKDRIIEVLEKTLLNLGESYSEVKLEKHTTKESPFKIIEGSVED